MLTRCVLACMCALLLDIAVVTSNASPIEVFSELSYSPNTHKRPAVWILPGKKRWVEFFFTVCASLTHFRLMIINIIRAQETFYYFRPSGTHFNYLHCECASSRSYIVYVL